MNTNLNKSFSLGNFTDKILQYANETFSVLHRRFLKEIWGNNSTTAKLHHNQCRTNWQNGTYEVYIPTRDDPNMNLRYSRIAIQVLPEISNATKRAEAYRLQQDTEKPLGVVESELLILVAYQQSQAGIVKGFKHQTQPGYFTGIFVSRQRSPELIWKRILDHITNFIQKRLDGLMRSLKLETWIWKWTQKTLGISTINTILEKYSLSIRQSAFTFLKLYQHFIDKMKLILHEIGIQNTAKGKTSREIRSEIEILISALRLKVKEEQESDKGLWLLQALQVNAHG